MILPKRLKTGDTIGIVSPSTPVPGPGNEQFKNGIAFLEGLGFKVTLGEHIFSTSWGYTTSPKEKAADINRMFADRSIQAILCSQGGATANACLPYLNWEVIRANPKIFLGISDITVLLNAIYHKTGLVTFHGNDLMWGFGRNPAAYDRQEFSTWLMEGASGEIKPNGERRTIRSGMAEGKLLGGNLNCLMKLAGTPYFPDFSGSLLLLEALNISTEDCDCYFQQLRQAGVFDQINGAAVGYIDGLQNDGQALMQMEAVLLRVSEEYNFPILKMNDFGHNCPNTVLPVGATARLDADQCSLQILKPCVR